jgi:hypothetical protein
MSAAHAPQPIELAVAALRSNWLIPNPVRTPAASPGLILFDISASSDDVELFGRHVEELTLDKPRPSKRKLDSTRKVETRPRLKQDDKPIAGPRSAEPGPWLQEGLVDCGMKERAGKLTKAGEGYFLRLRETQKSLRGVRHDGLHTIPTEGNSGFSMNDELFAEELEQETTKDAEVYDFEPQPKPKAKKTPTPTPQRDSDQKIAAYTPISSVGLNSAYSVWVDDPSVPNHSALWTAVYNCVQGQLEYTKNEVRDRFVGENTIEEEGQEFVLAFMNDLAGIEIKVSFAACLRKSWDNRKFANSRAFSKHRKRYEQDDQECGDDGDQTWSKLDAAAENAWKTGSYDMAETDVYDDAVMDIVEHAIEEMPQPERSMYEDRQAGQKQVEIAKTHKVSPSAVNQRFKKGDRKLRKKVSKFEGQPM